MSVWFSPWWFMYFSYCLLYTKLVCLLIVIQLQMLVEFLFFDKLNNESFKSWIESIQYKACVAITGATQKTSRECLYRELSLESLIDRCWFRKLTFFIKLLKVCLHDISLSTSIWGLLLITRLDLQIKTIYKNFPVELKALSILSSLFVLENGIN